VSRTFAISATTSYCKMAPELSRNHDRPTFTTHHYTMKTSRPPLRSSHSHSAAHTRQSQINSQIHRSNRSTTPVTSRMPHSAGQPYPPPKLSPGVASENRTSSPNYFGLNVELSPSSRDSNAFPQSNWSPPSSSVKSFGAAIPTQLPLEANPEFEAFKRQADANRSKGFALGGAPAQTSSGSFARPKVPRRATDQSDCASEAHKNYPSSGKPVERPASRMEVDSESLHDSAYVSGDSKRNSEVSLNAPSFCSLPRFESPAQSDSPFEPSRRMALSKVEERHPRLSLPLNKLDQPVTEQTKPRAETLPSTLQGGPNFIQSSQVKDMLQSLPESECLVIDLRVSTHYGQSRIRGALNLCIPTTLLKRATFDLQKLQKTLQTEEDQKRFSQWSESKHIVVYDSSSSEKRDALSAFNMLKKFANEGYTGQSHILRGGFQAFSASFPDLVDTRSGNERAGTTATTTEGGRPMFAPVIGGVMLPPTANSANPFFSNIRQNMDLADGVGQMDIAVPTKVDMGSLPRWLRTSVNKSDHGKKVSDRFLNIERSEQSRMKSAYSAFNAATNDGGKSGEVRLCGVEKGVKNRYKDILPFEHARVRLPDRPRGSCDYINASHIQASRSNKRYIASQGPLPATFEDFWSVVWDQDVRVIVMLTAESEGGQLKCHPYWTSSEFGSMKLKLLSEKKVSLDIDKPRSSTTNFSTSGAPEVGRRRANTTNIVPPSKTTPQPAPSQSETPYVVIRKFALSHNGQPFAPMREITHLYYPSWPDFGTPAQPSHLLALVELANVMQRAALPVDAHAIAASVVTENPMSMNWLEEPELNAQSRPMLVHCSAGCGRTGTFCAVDSVIDMMKRQHLALTGGYREGHQDYDGDVSMVDFKMPFGQGASEARQMTPKREKRGLDSNWVADMETDLIASTVEDFRQQRLSMVQSLRQFVLCYETVLEWAWRFQERVRPTAAGRARTGSLAMPM
jgi:protein tyrosine phosphatase